MLVLICGNGWISKQFITLFDKQRISYVVSKERVDDVERITEEIDNIKPTHVFCLIGRTHGTVNGHEIPTIDYLETPGKLTENIRDNLYAPVLLALVCKKKGIHMTYLGTGCIFEYDEEHPIGDHTHGFLETDNPNFFGSSYSIVKGFTDKLMRNIDNVLNIRIRMPITADISSRNFITKITSYEKICSVPNSMSVLPTLLPLVINMARLKNTGTVNLVNPGVISHNDILTMYKDIVDPSFTWTNFTTEEQDQLLLAKRSNNCLDTTILKTIYPDVPDIYTAVHDILVNMKQTLNG